MFQFSKFDMIMQVILMVLRCVYMLCKRRYLEAIRRLKAEGVQFLRTIHLTFTPGELLFRVIMSIDSNYCRYGFDR